MRSDPQADPRGDGDAAPAVGARAARAAFILLVGAGALLLAAEGLNAGPVSDDAAALGYVHAHGPLADFAGPQYDLRTVRFWRPLVTASLGLQEALTGTDFLALRLFNLACHAASALLAAALARRLGLRPAAAVLAAALALTFPYQGGTVTWIVGRVDSQCLPLVLATAWAALARRPLLSALAALAALATKEAGAAAPLVAAALLWGRGDGALAALRGAWPAAAGTAVGLVARRLAIGEWVGGYPSEVQAVGDDLLGGLAAVARALGPTALALPLLLALAAASRRGAWRAAAGALLAGLACLAPLAPLLASGALEPVHRRWLLAPDLFLGLATAAALGRAAPPGGLSPGGPRRWVAAVAWLLAGLLVVARGWAAHADVGRWHAAAQLAAAHEARVRQALEGVAPSDLPVLDATIPRVSADGAAYVAQWGVADRYRAPFEPTPRPVWPWRPLFEAAQSPRDSVTTPRDDLRWPPGEAHLTAVPLAVDARDAGQPVEAVRLDGRLLADAEPGAAPELVVWGQVAAPRIEFVLFTELGYGTGVWADAPAAERVDPEPGDPDGVVRFRRVLPLRSVFMAANRHGMPLYHVLRQAADLGAEVAYLELRAVDDARGRTDRPVAASRWIRLEWGDELRRALLPL